MIDYNLIVYIGIGLMFLIFILFIANEMDKRKKEEKHQERLNAIKRN